jgi:hypothetical protein
MTTYIRKCGHTEQSVVELTPKSLFWNSRQPCCKCLAAAAMHKTLCPNCGRAEAEYPRCENCGASTSSVVEG